MTNVAHKHQKKKQKGTAAHSFQIRNNNLPLEEPPKGSMRLYALVVYSMMLLFVSIACRSECVSEYLRTQRRELHHSLTFPAFPNNPPTNTN
jgi:hypothetical protein